MKLPQIFSATDEVYRGVTVRQVRRLRRRARRLPRVLAWLELRRELRSGRRLARRRRFTSDERLDAWGRRVWADWAKSIVSHDLPGVEVID